MNWNIILYIEKYNVICEKYILYLKMFFFNLLKKKTKLKLIVRFSYIKSNDLVWYLS